MTRAIATSSCRSVTRPDAATRSRPGPVGRVGAPPVVGEVVGEVREHLQEQGDGEAAERRVEPERRPDGQRGAEPDDDGRDRGRQRVRPDGQEPGAERGGRAGRDRRARGDASGVAHGRRGNLVKSGRRFSRNAVEPSCASSVV